MTRGASRQFSALGFTFLPGQELELGPFRGSRWHLACTKELLRMRKKESSMISNSTLGLAVLLSLTLSIPAFAGGPQTKLCGNTVAEVNALINNKFNGFPKNYALRFGGTWNNGEKSLTIDFNSPVKIKKYKLAFCPQDDGTIYFYVGGYKQIGGFITGTSRTINLVPAHKDIKKYAGTYAKGSAVAATNNNQK
jgi:hypothetical protein